ncbi:MAG TPA: FixH family protein [Byssovorax sp.]
MTLPALLRAAFAASLLAPLVACSSSESPGSSSSALGTGGSAPSICSTDPRAQVYAAGLSGKSSDGTITVTWVDADPSPPEKSSDNVFTIRVDDASGKPMSGATVSLGSFMPDHNHGSPTTPLVQAGSAPGEYVIQPVYLFMPGILQETFTVQSSGSAAKEEVVFTFCVDG